MSQDSKSAWDYVRELRIRGVFKNKQRKFLSHIAIYINKLHVYKVDVFANSDKKNGKRYGVTNQVVLHTPLNNPRKISFPVLKNELPGSDIGNKIIIYDLFKDDLLVYEGEEVMVTDQAPPEPASSCPEASV